MPATSGVSTIKELHELARTKPGGLTYASPGLGSSSHLIGAMLSKEFQTPMTHVAYRSSSDARADVLAGRVDFMFNSLLPFRGDVEVGTIKALAVVSHERISNAPNVPTMAEVGFPGVDLQGWFGLFAPAKTDADIIMKLNQIFVTAAANVSDFIAQQGFIVRTSTPAELRELVKNDVAKYAVIIKEANAAPQ